MSRFYKVMACAMLLVCAHQLSAQTIVRGKIIDTHTKEPVEGATLQCCDNGCQCGSTTNAAGEFEMRCTDCSKLSVTCIGYSTYQFAVSTQPGVISLSPSSSLMDKVVVSANRGEAVKRSEAPVAIALLDHRVLQETKAVSADQLLNKISGVNMVSLGNEQHQMSIRQPMTTKSLFLYLEDGIPIRTTGLYNHNALLEMNLAATRSIEVIKGPSSALYGSEAIGGIVNFITMAPSAVPVLKLSAQGNNIGYRRADLVSGFTKNKWGFALSGYYADKKNGYLEYSDFHKGVFTARVDYRFSDKTNLSNSITRMSYYSDMSGGIDSAMFASRSFKNLHTFTYRKVNALRYRSTLTQKWNDNSKTTATILYRKNAIEQNPAYRVKDDFRRVNGIFVGNKEVAHGEVNESRFDSYSMIIQHRQSFAWKEAVLTGGMNIDLSPSAFTAHYIRIKKDTVNNKYAGYVNTDSSLSDYRTNLNNYAGFLNFEFTPLERLRVVASLRYDRFRYTFYNNLPPSAFSGSANTANNFNRISPKVGATYNLFSKAGLYANYSQGFVPPQVSELYTGVKVPDIQPSIFHNYEAGGWLLLISNRLTADFSVYRLDGTNEIVSVKLDDGSYTNQNAGRTAHRGVEIGMNATVKKHITFRLSGAYSKHRFVEYADRDLKYDGNEMNNAPNWMYNAEVWYRPQFVKGFRIGAELQHIGSYFIDPRNTEKYEGYNVLNLRTGYSFKGIDVWLNVMNATDNYYSYITTKSAFGYSYQLAEPLNVNFGVSYDLQNLFQ